jgi:polysaccharide export outer membrane protein
MSITYAARLSAALWLFPLLVTSQTLEDKVIEARRLQAVQSMRGAAGPLEDTLANDAVYGNSRGLASKRAEKKRAREGFALDSLLSGPMGREDSLDSREPDSIWVKDSLGKMNAIPNPAKAVPKRYEQRIFRSVDAATFSSAGGSAGRDYILGSGDEVTVSIWGDKEKEYSLILNNEGKIFLEGIGVVLLAGNTLDQAMVILKQKLAKVYSGIGRGTAHLDVTLGKPGPIRVYVLGDVKVPGGYVFTGHTSVLSALYFAKGPTDIGTVRNLQLTRSGNKYPLDLYKYLLKGESLTPHSLQDGDILFSGRAEALVSIDGDVGRPATYELKKGEGIKELLEFSGGVNPSAASHKLTLQRYFPDGRSDFIDLALPQDYLSGKMKMPLQDGDKVNLTRSTETSANYLVITGPVKYPGTYEATGVASVTQLVAKAGGLREDAYLGRVHVVRFGPDGSSSLMAYSLDSTAIDSISLQPKDNVLLYSVKDMYLADSLQIAGAVFKPGKYEFRAGTTVKDLVMQAGGFLPHHEAGKLLVFRGNGRERKVTQIALDVEDGLAKTESDFRLNPGDLVQVPVDPQWYQKEVVTLDGLFLHPGKYALLHPGEKLSSVVQRAGGFKGNAYVEGGRFFRSRDSVGRVGVDIALGVRSPRSKTNIALVGGDSIYIPERLNTVKVIGEVGFETSVLFKSGATVQYYLEKAGGFTRRSEKDRVVVQYANGETSRDGYFNRKPDAGSVIYVPQGPEPTPVNWVASINALLGTVGVVVALILSIQAISK